ncbi:MAG: YebC/PmpR family DNA-binding transcriptional regulator, partial [Burkholderiales bacterium]
AFQFKHCGQLVFAPGINEDALIEVALDAGAIDVLTHVDGSIEVLTNPHDYLEVKNVLEAKGFKAELAEVTMKAENEAELSGDEAVKMQKLLDAFEELDDVQEVYTNAVLDVE